MSTGRDDFSKATVDALAKRAGYLCSNPDCRQLTVGAHTIETKATIIGEAAHITAAAEGGPRYNEKLTTEQRSHISNGIWLCSSCATLIDKDELSFPDSLLHEWKGGVEAETKLKLRGGFKGQEPQIIESPTKKPILEVDFAGGGRGRSNKGFSMKNPQEMHDGVLVMNVGTEPVIHWHLHWRYQLVIYNNSSYPAFNVKIENLSTIDFAEFEHPPRINNIPALDKKELKLRYEDHLEGVWHEAEALLKSRYPASFDDHLILRITYQSEDRKDFETLVKFKNGELINRVE